MAESDDEDFAALFAASEGKRPRERRVAAGDVVRGRVIAVGATAAFVAVGDKAEATIELGEFRDPATGEVQLHEGDEIEATVVDDGTRSGSIVLKRVAGRGGHVPPRLRGVRRSRGRRWSDPRERARLRPGVPPIRRAAGGPAGRSAGREARARPEGWAWPRGALPPRART